MPTTAPDPSQFRPAGILLVLATGIYDGLLCVAIAFVTSALAVALNQGEAIEPGNHLFEVAILASLFPYFAWCWMRGGRTLGMRAWGLRLVTRDGAPVSMTAALLRYLGVLVSIGLLGAGFLWMLVDPQGMSLHDRLSGTQVYRER